MGQNRAVLATIRPSLVYIKKGKTKINQSNDTYEMSECGMKTLEKTRVLLSIARAELLSFGAKRHFEIHLETTNKRRCTRVYKYTHTLSEVYEANFSHIQQWRNEITLQKAEKKLLSLFYSIRGKFQNGFPFSTWPPSEPQLTLNERQNAGLMQ